jgi:hypothetical protein
MRTKQNTGNYLRLFISLLAVAGIAAPAFAEDKQAHSHKHDNAAPPSQFDADKSSKFNEAKWRTLTNDGIAALDQKKYESADKYFQAAVREASKSSLMSTFMIDSLVHTAEVYRLTDRKDEAKETFDQALALVRTLVPEKCPLCGSEKDSVPVIYGPHSEELDEWIKAKAVQMGDFTDVTKKGRKNRPEWYCQTCEKAY